MGGGGSIGGKEGWEYRRGSTGGKGREGRWEWEYRREGTGRGWEEEGRGREGWEYRREGGKLVTSLRCRYS